MTTGSLFVASAPAITALPHILACRPEMTGQISEFPRNFAMEDVTLLLHYLVGLLIASM